MGDLESIVRDKRKKLVSKFDFRAFIRNRRFSRCEYDYGTRQQVEIVTGREREETENFLEQVGHTEQSFVIDRLVTL